MTCEFPGCTNDTGVTTYCVDCRKSVKPNIGSAHYAVPLVKEKQKSFKRTALELSGEYWTLLADRYL